MIKLDELQAILDRATPGPWYARGRMISRVRDDTGMGGTLHTNHVGTATCHEDAAAIVAMREAMPALIAIARAALAAGRADALEVK